MRSPHPHISLTKQQHEVLTGLMLGDGSLHLNKKNRSVNARLTVRRGIEDRDYLLWQHSFFRNFCSEKAIREYSDYHKRADKFYDGISFNTIAHPIFTEYHTTWYHNIKRVPSDLSLNQLLMLIWFLDDGHIERCRSDKLIIKLSTDGFAKDDVLFLCDLLRHRYGQKYTVYQNSHPKNSLQSGLRICGYGSSTEVIINDIREIYPYDLMARKATWAQPYVPKIHSYDIKSDMIYFYLTDKNIFYTNDLGRFAGFCFQRKDKLGRKGGIEVASGNLRKNYLSAYIDKELIIKLEDDNYHLGAKYGVTKKGRDYFSLGANNEVL